MSLVRRDSVFGRRVVLRIANLLACHAVILQVCSDRMTVEEEEGGGVTDVKRALAFKTFEHTYSLDRTGLCFSRSGHRW